MKQNTGKLALFSASHLLVDFACAFSVFASQYGSANWVTLLIIYNFCAFALQFPLGILLDKYRDNCIFASIGALMVAGSFMLTSFPYLLVIFLGLGNALFHIGAGRDVLLAGRGKYTQLGVFVSPGAVGLFAGTLLGKLVNGGLDYRQMVILAAALMCVGLIMLRQRDCESDRSEKSQPEPKSFAFLAVFCLFVVVCLRSYVGMALFFPWKTTVWFAAASVLALAGGKVLGGILADRFGAAKVSYITLMLCAVLAFFWKTPACGLVSILLFNMTMPISLGAVYKHMPKYPGAGFGLLTLALFLGVLPAMLGVSAYAWFMPWGFAIAAAFSAGLLLLGLKEKRNG